MRRILINRFMLYNIAKSNKLRNFSGTKSNELKNSGTDNSLTHNNFYFSNDDFEPKSNFKVSYHIVFKDDGIIPLVAGATDKITGAPLNNTSFIFIPLMENNNKVIEKETSGKGQFLINSMEEGTYKVFVKKPGYYEQTLDITVKKNLTLFLEIVLETE